MGVLEIHTLKNSMEQAPRRANPGLEGEEIWIWLRLKILADVGLLGLPNVGKSSLLSAITNANPKIGNYAYTNPCSSIRYNQKL